MATADEWSGRRETGGEEPRTRQRNSAGKVSRWARFGSRPSWFVRLHVQPQPPHLARSPDPSAHRSAGGNCERAVSSLRRPVVGRPTALKLRGRARRARTSDRRNALPFLPPSPRSQLTSQRRVLRRGCANEGEKPQRNLWRSLGTFSSFSQISTRSSLTATVSPRARKRGVREARRRWAACAAPASATGPSGRSKERRRQ